MKRSYLYRLYKHSRWAFLFVVLFMACYAVLFYKKMDMTFFPYNSMYSVDHTKANTASTYGMKVNGDPVRISHQPYWKKDLLETSLYGYCRYIRNNHTVFLDGYLHQRFANESIRNILLPGLTPVREVAIYWPRWYGRFAGYPVPANASIELLQYNFRYEKGQAILTDSISIYKTILP